MSLTATPQTHRRASFRGKGPFILAISVAALCSAGIFLDAARGDLVVDSGTFDENFSNNYTGNTFVRSTTSPGTLNLNVPNALPTGTRSAITMDDGTSTKGGSAINLNGNNQVAASLSSPFSAIGASSAINLSSAILTIGNVGGPNTTYYGDIADDRTTGGGGLIKDGTSTQILASNMSFFGTVSVTGGDLELGTAATAGSFNSANPIILSGGTLTLIKPTGGVFVNSVTNGVGGVGTLVINSVTATTLNGTLTDGSAGQVALTQSGAGKAILTQSSSFTGATTVTTGELQIGTTASAASIGATSAVSVGNSGTVTLVNLITTTAGVTTPNVFQNDVSNGVGGVGTLRFNSVNTNTVSGTLSDGAGTLAVTQDGAGVTILTGANSYSGATTVNHGTLQIGDGVSAVASLSSAVQVNAGTNFLIDDAFVTDVNLNAASVSLKGIQTGLNVVFGVISGAGSVIQNGIGTTILDNANTYTGATTINTGTLQIGDDFTSGVSIATSGKVKVNADGTLAIALADGETFGNAVSLNTSTATLNGIASGMNTLTGVISGIGGVTQSGTGTTILAAKETYTGATTVTGGILQIGAATAASIASSSVDVTNTGTLSLVNVINNTFSKSVTNNETGLGTLNGNSTGTITVSGAVTDGNGQIALTQTGTGTTILTGANKTYSGGTTVTSGFLQVGTATAAGSIGSGLVTISGGTVTLVNISGNALNNNVTNGQGAIGTLLVNSSKTISLYGSVSDGSAGQIALTQSGTGTTILANADDSYTGPTAVTKGTLQIGTTGIASLIGTTSASVSNGARINMVNLNGAFVGSISNGVGGIGTVLVTSANTTTITGALTDGALGTLAVTQSGTGTTVLANAANTYTGATKVTKGTLRIGTATIAGSIGATSAVSVSNGGLLTLANVNGNTFSNNVSNGVGGVGKLTVNSANTNTVSGLLANGTAGQLALAQNGVGTTILTHANIYSGGTTIGGGTLLVNNTGPGSGTGTGAVTVNSNGTLGGSGTITGPVTLNSGGFVAPGAGSPGVAGTTLHESSMTWNGGGTVSLQIASGSIADALALSGALTKGTTAGGFTIQITGTGVAGEDYTLATFGSTTFSVANFKLQLPAHYAGTLVETATSLTLDLTSTTAPAAIHFAALAGPVTADDTSAASDSFSAPALSDPIPAPEPGSAALLSLGACALLGWRRRRK
jgi:fibronectin-binding autotransporter adhesin